METGVLQLLVQSIDVKNVLEKIKTLKNVKNVDEIKTFKNVE